MSVGLFHSRHQHSVPWADEEDESQISRYYHLLSIGAQLQEVPTAQQKEQQAEQWCSKKLFLEDTLPYIPQHIHSLVGYALNRISVRISFLLWRHLI